jgi:hypothetical protein
VEHASGESCPVFSRSSETAGKVKSTAVFGTRNHEEQVDRGRLMPCVRMAGAAVKSHERTPLQCSERQSSDR